MTSPTIEGVDALVLSPMRAGILMHLARAGGPARIDDLVDALGVGYRGALQTHREKLARAGLVRIERTGTTITSSGVAALAKLGAAINDVVREEAE